MTIHHLHWSRENLSGLTMDLFTLSPFDFRIPTALKKKFRSNWRGRLSAV